MRNLRDNKRGLSEVVVTLIIILLGIVAAGIVWIVVGNLVGDQSERIASGTQCLETNVRATKVTGTEGSGNYDVTLTRSASGDEIAGVRMVFTNEIGTTSYVHNAAGNIAPLATKTITGIGTGITDANKVEIFVYFEDSQGREQICQTSTSYNF
jgi:hypothetical protein